MNSGARPRIALPSVAVLAQRLWGAPLVVLLVCLPLWPALFLGEAFFLRDAQTWFYPSRLYLRQRILQGELPSWIPELNLGMPFLADPGNGVFYPPNLILLLPAPDSVSQFLALHVLLAALGSYYLLGVLGLCTSARVLGALSFGLSGYTLSMTTLGVYLLSMAWMPLVVALGVQAQRHARPGRTAGFAAALGCQLLGGEPQAAIFTALLLFSLLAAEPRRSQSHWLHFVAGGLAGVLLAMPQVLPALAFLSGSERQAGMDFAETSRFSVHPLRLVELLVPGSFGNPYDNPHYLGYFLVDSQRELTPWSASLYAGSLVVVFASYSIVSRRALHEGWGRAVSVVLAAVLLLALGRHTPVFAQYQSLVPGADYFRYPEKFFALATLCFAMLGALGLDRALRGPALPNRRLLGLTAGLAVMLGVAVVAGERIVEALRRQRPVVDHAQALERLELGLIPEAALVGLAALLLFWVRRRRSPQSWLAPALALLGGLQLLLANQSLIRTTSGDLYTAAPTLTHLEKAGTASEARRLFVPDRTGSLFAPCLKRFEQVRVAEWKRLVLKMNTGIVHGVHYARAYTSFASPESLAVWQRLANSPDAAFDLFSVGYFLAPRSASAGPALVATPCFAAHANPDPLPYARVVYGASHAASLKLSLDRLSHPSVQEGRIVVVESQRALPSNADPSPAQACRYRRERAEKISIDCSATRRGWLVVNEAYHRHWQATVNGSPAPVTRANGMVMAVALPGGKQRVVLTYTDPWLGHGVAAFGVGLLLLLGMLVAGRRQRRSASPRAEPRRRDPP